MSASADPYRVTITASTRRGHVRTLRSCELVDPSASDVVDRWRMRRGWHKGREARRQRLGRALVAASQTTSHFDWDYVTPEGSVFDLPEVIADGLAVTRRTLFTICDAVYVFDRTSVDVDNLKRVVSQQGTRLAELHLLPEPARRLAGKALYERIAETLY